MPTFRPSAAHRRTGKSQLTESFPSETALNIVYTYDAGTNGKGHLTSVTDGSGSTVITYDDRGNVLSEVRTINSVAHTTSYAYDLADNVTQITYPNGRIVNYSRDALGRISGITTKADSGSSSVNVATSVSYEAFGPLTGFTFGNSLAFTADYDQDFRVTDIEAGSVQDKAYGYDTVNNITSITDGVTPWDSQSFAYDDLDRLETDDGSYGDTDYAYDANGNRLSKVLVNGGTTTETTTIHSTSNRLNVSNGTTISHDAAGNQLNAAGSQVFEYNARNRMDVFKISTTLTAEYVHNAFGQRVEKSVYGGSTDVTVFHFGLSGEILGTTTYLGGGGKTHVQIVWLDGKPVAQYTQIENGSGVITGTETLYLHTDHLDTPRLATGASGAVKWRWDVDAFGVGTQDTDPDNDTADSYVNLRFPGQYYDAESGMHYNYFRTYDPSIGRYTQSDPIGLNGGLNTYGYVGGNPLAHIDPMGQSAEVVVVGGGIILVGGTIAYAACSGSSNPWCEAVRDLGDRCLDSIEDLIGPYLDEIPEGASADDPGKPTEADGFKPSKKPPSSADGKVKNPNGPGRGWEDAKGNVWVPTGHGPRAHGGPHWDVQNPRTGRHTNVHPGGRQR